jgi:transcriptional regulator with XRE-family HTH domain
MATPRDRDPFLRRVGKAVATLRRRREWSQETLGQRLGTTAKAIAKFESGYLDLRLTTVAKLANALDVTPGQLLDTEPDSLSGRTVRKPSALAGLAATGWVKAKAHTPNAIPLLDLRPRAGRPQARPEPLALAWAAPPPGRHPTEAGLFIAQVRGDSMAPQLPDGSWCLFARTVDGSALLGQTVLVGETDATGLTAWSVKRVDALRASGDGRLLVELASRNPAYPPRTVALDGSGDVHVAAVVREVLRPRAARPLATSR